MNNNEQLLDKFAGIALSALIQKMPFLDIKGEQGKEVTPEELQRIKKELTGSAYEYASWMLIAKEQSMAWLEENKAALSTT